MLVEHAVRAAAEVVIHQVVAELAGAAAEPAGPDVGGRAHEQPRRVERRRAEEDDLRRVVRGLLGDGVEHAHAGRALAVAVVDHVGHDRERLERQPAGRHRRRQRRRLRAEVGAVRAAEPARVAVLAARRGPASACVRLATRPGMMRRVPSNSFASRPATSSSPQLSGIAGWNWPSGSCGSPSTRAGDAGVPLDVVVPRRDVGVADRPVDRDAFLRVGLEVEVAPAIALAAPHQRAAADLIAAIPVEALDLGVRRLLLVDPPVEVLLVERVVALEDRIRLLHRARAAAAMRILPRRLASR